MMISLSAVSAARDSVRGILILFGIAALMLLAGCAGTRGGPIPYDVENFATPDAPVAAPLEDDYKIAPLDTLKIAVFQVTDLSGEYEVDLTGNIALPLIGNIKAIDKTPRQLQTELEQKYGEKYLQNPDVSVGVKSSSRRAVTIDGAVREPGMYPVTSPVSLIQAVAMAKGTNDMANPRRVAVFRQIGGQRMAAAFDLTSIRRGEMQDPKIYAGDIVVVDGSNVRSVQREILSSLPIIGLFNPFLR